jgi:glycine/D-amino acid oxidase-like deaminating enzyme
MKLHAATQPFWSDSATFPSYPRLERDESVDVAIVGAGITGLTTAYLLAREGCRVAVLERERCAQAVTGHTSGHLTMVTDQRLSALVDAHGRDHAQAVWDAGLAAIGQIATHVADLAIDCDFAWVPGYLHPALGENGHNAAAFAKEAALAGELGFDAEYVDEVPFVGGPGVRFGDQARFHPRNYLAALARAITDRGGLIFERSAAEQFGDRPVSVTANGHTITCRSIVSATHTPLAGNAATRGATLFQTALAPSATYVVGGHVAAGRVPDALFWDTADPYHYLRIEPHRGHDYVIFGGEDHKTEQARDIDGCFDRLERTLHLMIEGVEITHRWFGQVVAMPDGLPSIGETAARQFTATGFAGNGLTFGTLAGMMAADWIAGRKNPWRDLFEPGRTRILGGLWDYLQENKDYPYYRLRDRVAGADGRSVRAVSRPGGA